LKRELQYFDYSELSEKEIKAWNTMVDRLETSMEHLHHYRDIESFREGFKGVSESIIAMIDLMGHGKEVLYRMNCSMADASWLQADKELLNPYYGQSMLRCGDIVSQLPAIPVSE
jgi:Cu(I)/Ag(I) efflux system membrane fusion protein